MSAPAPGAAVEIHYTRPPGRLTVFRQRLVQHTDGCIITLMEATPLTRPVQVNGRTVLGPDDAVVWFTFPGRWHDIGRFHAGGEFTGCYANILTPVAFRTPLEWETTDLFLDVWRGADGLLTLLDEEELDAAAARGDVSAADATRARREAAELMRSAEQGSWPPPVVAGWSLERARAMLR